MRLAVDAAQRGQLGDAVIRLPVSVRSVGSREQKSGVYTDLPEILGSVLLKCFGKNVFFRKKKVELAESGWKG